MAIERSAYFKVRGDPPYGIVVLKDGTESPEYISKIVARAALEAALRLSVLSKEEHLILLGEVDKSPLAEELGNLTEAMHLMLVGMAYEAIETDRIFRAATHATMPDDPRLN